LSSKPNFRVAIPARYQSSRLPGKPLLHIADRPMIQWAYETAQKSGATEVIVATDDERIAQAVANFGGQVCLTRSDHASGSDRLAEVAAQQGWQDSDIIVNLQGDEPLLPPALLAQVASGLEAHPEAGIATLCTRIDDIDEVFDPNAVKVVFDQRGFALYFSRSPVPYHRQAFGAGKPETLPNDVAYWRHLGIYAYRAGVLSAYPKLPKSPLEDIESLEQLRGLWNGIPIHVQAAVELPPPGVDTQDDLDKINQWYAKIKK
jgi:3-deoxy-manno-octulosonate cytidylyltransferase (CMP-KDO synthetase)